MPPKIPPMSHQLVVELGGAGGGGDGGGEGGDGDGRGRGWGDGSLLRVKVMVVEVPAPATLVAETTIAFSPPTKLTAWLNAPSVTVIVLVVPLSVRVASVIPGSASMVPSMVIRVV